MTSWMDGIDMVNLYQDMNGTLFTVEQYQNCTHQDIVFCIDKQLYKVICNCGHIEEEGGDVREVLSCSADYPWKPSGTINLVEHIREYFYAGHNTVCYRERIPREYIEEALFL